MRSGLLATFALAALIAGCGAPAAPAPTLAPAASAGPTADPVALALETYKVVAVAPGDGAALRQALDQVELALALAQSEPGRREELSLAERDLLARIERIQPGRASEAPAIAISPSAEAAPPVAEAAPAPAATGAAMRQTRPAATAAARPAFTIATRKSFEGSGNSGQYASCIDVQILGRAGPVGGAVIGINNGEHSYQDQTDQSGYAGRCGLGASTWSVVLFWTPGGGQAQGATTTVYLSGAPEQRAAVVFQER